MPPESASLKPLARLNANRSSLFKKITSPCDGLKRQLNLFPREVFHPFLERELEFYNPFFHINNSTHGAKKRTSQNNWTRRFTFNVHNSKINGNIIVIDNDKNIIDLPQRFIHVRIDKTNTKRTRIKRFQFKHIIHSFGHNRGTCSNITKSIIREVIQFDFYHRIPTIF